MLATPDNAPASGTQAPEARSAAASVPVALQTLQTENNELKNKLIASMEANMRLHEEIKTLRSCPHQTNQAGQTLPNEGFATQTDHYAHGVPLDGIPD